MLNDLHMKSRRLCAPSVLAHMAIFLSMAIWASSSQAADPAVFNITDYGAVGDGLTINTTAIQSAIDACHADGGGIVRVPVGRYVSGTIQLKDNITLHLDEQAFILGSTIAADYLNLDPFTAGDGVPLGHALIVAMNAKHVGLDGPGTIDGRGSALKGTQTKFTVRPFLIRWLGCSDVTVKDLHLTGPGAWTLNFFQCTNVQVNHVTIRSRGGLPNNDGIDLDSCEGVEIKDCDIDSGDDALCLKTTSPKPCRNIVATGCKLITRCNGIKLGTESLGDFEKIQVSNCELRNIGMAGIALYCVDGGQLTDVTIKDVKMDVVSVPIAIRLGSRLKTFRPIDDAKPTGILRNVTIENVQATGAKLIGLLVNGVPDHPVEAISLTNIHLELAGGGVANDAKILLPEKENAYPEYSMFGRVMPSYGIYLRHVKGVTFKDVTTTPAKPDARPEKCFIDVKDVLPETFIPSTMPATQP